MEQCNEVVIVTGAAKGLGKAICLVLLEYGYKVCLADVNEDAGRQTLEEIEEKYGNKAMFIKCDVSSEKQFRDLFKKTMDTFDRVDIVINNAGILDENNWSRMVDINLTGTINGMKLSFHFMGKNNGGNGGLVLNIASNAAIHGFPLAPVYSATKHGILGLTRSYGSDTHMEKTGVVVCAICPSAMETEMLDHFVQCSPFPDEAVIHNKSLEPMKTSYVAEAVLQLLKENKNGAIMKISNDGFHYIS